MPKTALALSRVYRLLEPGPVVLVTTANRTRANVMTLSWHLMMEFVPPLVGRPAENVAAKSERSGLEAGSAQFAQLHGYDLKAGNRAHSTRRPGRNPLRPAFAAQCQPKFSGGGTGSPATRRAPPAAGRPVERLAGVVAHRAPGVDRVADADDGPQQNRGGLSFRRPADAGCETRGSGGYRNGSECTARQVRARRA